MDNKPIHTAKEHPQGNPSFFLEMGGYCHANHKQPTFNHVDSSVVACGEDAYCFLKTANYMGVADGVSSWTFSGRGNAAYFAYYLLAFVKQFIERGEKDTFQLLWAAYEEIWKRYETKELMIPNGSATVCLARLTGTNPLFVQYTSVGDCMIWILRPFKEGDSIKVQLIHKSAKKYMGKPFWSLVPVQLTFCPEKHKKDCPLDTSLDIITENVEVQPGDILINASDGLWDNIEDSQVLGLVSNACNNEDSKQHMAGNLAQQLVKTAFCNNKKPDDISVIVGIVCQQTLS